MSAQAEPAVGRVAIALALASLLAAFTAGCRDRGAPPDPVPAVTEPELPAPVTSAQPEPDLEPEPPPPPPAVDPEIVLDLGKWDAATTEEREAAARYIDERAGRFEFARLETFTCGGATHEVAVFSHLMSEMEFVLLPATTFQMGSPASDADRKADEIERMVTLSRPFLIARTEVTQKDWFKHLTTRGTPHFPGDQNPMENATFHDMRAFLYRTELELPTEAQWEYACRAGTTTRFHFGDDEKQLGEYAWFESNSLATSHPVGQKKPNAFGLHDMHGNVWERCTDGYERYGPGAVTDPQGEKDAADLICRGGSHANLPSASRSAFRYPVNPGDKHGGVGLRTIWVIPAP